MKREIKKRVKEIRTGRGLTMKELADAIGCTKSYISQIESGAAAPSLSMLGKLAKALNVAVVDLFDDEGVSNAGHMHLKKDERIQIVYPDGRIVSQLLVDKVTNKKMEPLLSIIQPGGASDRVEKLAHEVGCEEFILVMKGQLDFQVGDSEYVTLREGDSFYFEGHAPHHWINNGTEPAEVLFVFTPPVW